MIDKILNYSKDLHTFTVDWEFVESIPEFAKLKTIEQSPEWHAEGNAWIHTKQVVNESIDMCVREELNKYYSMILILSALFHDIGKTTTTFTGNDGKIHSYGHDRESDKITRRILWEEKLSLRETICSCVKLHMQCHDLKKIKQYNAFKKRVDYLKENALDFKLLSFLHYCDVAGSNYDGKLKGQDLFNASGLISYAHNGYNLRNFYLSTHTPTSFVKLMIGLPGSRKSTKVAELNKDNKYIVLSRDTIRAELGFCAEGEKIVCTKEQEDEVSNVFEDRFVKALQDHKNIIIDNINLRRSYRDNYKELARNYNVYWSYIYCQAPSLEDNYTCRPMISKEIFDNMIYKFDYPEPSEYDSMIISI